MSEFDVISAASTRTGNNSVTSYETGDAVSGVAARSYQRLVRAELSGHPWLFARKFAPLNLLDPAVHGAPLEPWQFAYQLPADLLELRTLESYGIPVDYEKMHSRVFCDVGPPVTAIYTWRAPEDDWPGYFEEYIIQRMEALFLRAIGERFQEGDARLEEALKVTLPRAKRLDAQSQSSRNPVRSPILVARTGSTRASRG